MKKFNIKTNHAFIMLGTAGELPKAPEEPTKFIEDMTDYQIARVSKNPSGLVNLGNTCYMNSSLQALRSIPEIKDNLKKYRSNNIDLTDELKALYSSMEGTSHSAIPAAFLNSLRNRFPQFAETDDSGHYKQQDAEEFWTQLLGILRDSLNDSGDSVVDKYLSGSFDVEMKTDEAPDEAPSQKSEVFTKLNCHISNGTNYLKDGLVAGLTDTLEKNCEMLGRNAEYKVTKKITRLPKYLTIQFVRFYWRRDTQKKSKILHRVAFPQELDVTDLCSDELKKKIIPVREKLQEIRKEEEDARRSAKKARFDPSLLVNGKRPDPITEEKKKEYRAEVDKVVDDSLKSDKGTNPSALYELTAVVTHKGANADSGHYKCYVRNDEEEGMWWRFDDDKVSLIDESKIEALAGGGESDSALIVLYRAADV